MVCIQLNEDIETEGHTYSMEEHERHDTNWRHQRRKSKYKWDTCNNEDTVTVYTDGFKINGKVR